MRSITPKVLHNGIDVTIAASGYSTLQAMNVSQTLSKKHGVSCEVIDLRQINPLDHSVLIASVEKTGLLCVIDGGWKNCGLAGEVIASVAENVDPKFFKKAPIRITLPASPAPSAANLEAAYYNSDEDIEQTIIQLVSKK